MLLKDDFYKSIFFQSGKETCWFNSFLLLPLPFVISFMTNLKGGAGPCLIFQLAFSLWFRQPLTLSHYVILTKINEGESQPAGVEKREAEAAGEETGDRLPGPRPGFNSPSPWFTIPALIPCLLYPQDMKNGRNENVIYFLFLWLIGFKDHLLDMRASCPWQMT